MREGHKHLFWFLLAVAAAIWGLNARGFDAEEPRRGVRGLSSPKAEP